MASSKVLLEWSRVTCASYPGVDIKDMSSSFRDGLAFCAIIHKHRPDLINFSSLSKDDVYQNNKLAFEVAETKLGLPALLDPEDLASANSPDPLGVITYISQFYYLFSRKPCAFPSRSRSFHIIKTNKTSDGLKSFKSSADLETSSKEQFPLLRREAVCALCFKPVHLIQRRLSAGRVYHRSCFRINPKGSIPKAVDGMKIEGVQESSPVGSHRKECKICHSSLLFDPYTHHGSDTSSLICAHHVKGAPTSPVDLSQQTGSTDNKPRCGFQTGFSGLYSLDGSAITSVPRYAQTAVPQADEEHRSVVDGEGRGEAVRTSDLSSACGSGTGRPARPVPAPRQSLDSTLIPVPALKSKNDQTPSSSSAAESTEHRSKSPLGSSHISNPKVKTSHPWMNLVHPGPWTQLPPAPPPVPLSTRSKSASNVLGSSSRRRILAPPNPFEEEEVGSSVTVVQSETSEDTRDVVRSEDLATSCEQDAGKPPDQLRPLKTPQSEGDEEAGPDPADQTVEADTDRGSTQAGVKEAAREPNLPRSLCALAKPSKRQTSCVSAGRQEAGGSVTSCGSESEESPSAPEPGPSISETFQDLSSTRGPAPGHGFPLIRRKVQTDGCVSMEDLQKQKKELDGCLEELEQQGVDLERNIRDCRNGKEEDQRLTEWIALFHERHITLHKDKELVYLIKQQKLEDRQADTEYELRRLLNKPETDWSPEDRGREQQLMHELVTIIEQRNQIISSLDQDVQRENGDVFWENRISDKDSQKEGLMELKKSKGKFKPAKVFKKLNHRPENSKNSVEKKS